MQTVPDTTRELRELAAAIAHHPAQSADAVAALGWVRARLAEIIASAEPAHACDHCEGLAAVPRALLN